MALAVAVAVAVVLALALALAVALAVALAEVSPTPTFVILSEANGPLYWHLLLLLFLLLPLLSANGAATSQPRAKPWVRTATNPEGQRPDPKSLCHRT